MFKKQQDLTPQLTSHFEEDMVFSEQGKRIEVSPFDSYEPAQFVSSSIGSIPTIKPSITYNDPLLASYWHLQPNNGTTHGTNVVDVWNDYRGTGVVVGVIDDGIDYNHPDLQPNYGFNLDYDARDQDFDAFPSDPTDQHGTSVAGVIGAALNNGVGGSGVAPEATLVGYRIGFGENSGIDQILHAYQRLDLLDVANNSWGYDGYLSDNFWSFTFAPIANGLHLAVDTGRGGLGTIVVFSAGNDRNGGQDTNYHNFQNDRSIITVAATTSTGDIANFSTPGASILVAAPGVGIPTTDRVGSSGFASGDYATLNGTSFSAPIISGVAALMLDANPNLGWRDVQEILAVTASQTGSASSWSINTANNWNGGGMHTSHDFGFGLVNALAAVRVAESWRSTSTSANEQVVSNSSSPNEALADVGSYSTTLTLADGLRIDHVEIDVSMAHTNIGQLQLLLTSPNGTQSLLFHNPTTSQDDIDFKFSTTHDWGELSGGDWTLTITDTGTGAAGTLLSWAIHAYGDPVGDDTYVYTDEFSSLAASDPNRLQLTDTSGTDNINTTAIGSATLVDLRSGQESSIDGQLLTIVTGTVIENVDTGDGNDTLIGNDVANWLRGWRGNDTLDGGLGADSLEGGAGDDSYIINETGDSLMELAGGGIDTVISSITYTLSAQLENLTLVGSAVIDGVGNLADNIMTGNSAANYLSADDGNDTLDGGGDADLLEGGLGNDLYIVDNSADVVVEALGAGLDTVQASINSVLTDNIENLVLTGNAALTGTGNQLDNLIIGNTAANTLSALDGNDTLDGGAGADTLVGGLGNDSYWVDDNNDVIVEQFNEGLDVVTSTVSYVLGSYVENLILSGAAINGTGNDLNNSLSGTDLANYLYGQAGNDTLTSGAGDDLLNGGLDSDQLIGGLGNDTYVIDSAGDTLVENASEGTDTVQTTLLTYSLPVNLENLSYLGTGNFNGTGNTVANIVQGNAGDDNLDGGAGIDTLIGGAGSDTYVIDVVGDIISESANSGIDTVRTALASYTLIANLENLTYTGAAKFTGTGNSGNNQIAGGIGNDVLNGAAGSDTLIGGLGNDSYTVDNIADNVIELASAGTDTISASTNYSLPAEVENLILTGSSAINGTGNSLKNTLTGNAAANHLSGLDGNDSLDGKAGADTLSGGAGNDLYTVDNSGDSIIENLNEGTDQVKATVSYTLSAEVENLTLTGSLAISGTGNSKNNIMVGNTGNNSLFGLGGNDNLNGGAGADTLVGGVGNDIYTVDNSGDIVTEAVGEGTDTINSSVSFTLADNVENLTLTGSAAINAAGNSLNNLLTGNTGANTLDGGLGSDKLKGGSGNDIFVFHAGEAAGDVVSDFFSNGTLLGDTLQFMGFGAGATFMQVGATDSWSILYNGGVSNETIQLVGVLSLSADDYAFV